MADLERVESGSLKGLLEALLLVSDDSVSATDLARAAHAEPGEVASALAELSAEYADANRGFQLREVAGLRGRFGRLQPVDGLVVARDHAGDVAALATQAVDGAGAREQQRTQGAPLRRQLRGVLQQLGDELLGRAGQRVGQLVAVLHARKCHLLVVVVHDLRS
mgnify:CR=1 FL=1